MNIYMKMYMYLYIYINMNMDMADYIGTSNEAFAD